MITTLVLIFMFSGISMGISFARKGEPATGAGAAWLTSTLIAHRGIHNHDTGIYENTMPAFALAIAGGYAIELDVTMTKDHRLVVYHDKKLKRLLGLDKYLSEMNYDALARLKFPHSDEGIPLFEDVLGMVNGKVPLLIEIKNEGEAGAMESMIYDVLKSYGGTYAIQSFNPYTVAWFRNNAPHVLRGQLSGSFAVSDDEVEFAGTTRLPGYQKYLLSNLLLNFISRPNFIAYEIKNTDMAKLESLKKLGVPILGWTIKSAEDYQETKHVFDNFIVESFEL